MRAGDVSGPACNANIHFMTAPSKTSLCHSVTNFPWFLTVHNIVPKCQGYTKWESFCRCLHKAILFVKLLFYLSPYIWNAFVVSGNGQVQLLLFTCMCCSTPSSSDCLCNCLNKVYYKHYMSKYFINRIFVFSVHCFQKFYGPKMQTVFHMLCFLI